MAKKMKDLKAGEIAGLAAYCVNRMAKFWEGKDEVRREQLLKMLKFTIAQRDLIEKKEKEEQRQDLDLLDELFEKDENFLDLGAPVSKPSFSSPARTIAPPPLPPAPPAMTNKQIISESMRTIQQMPKNDIRPAKKHFDPR